MFNSPTKFAVSRCSVFLFSIPTSFKQSHLHRRLHGHPLPAVCHDTPQSARKPPPTTAVSMDTNEHVIFSVYIYFHEYSGDNLHVHLK